MLIPESIIPADRHGIIYVLTHRESGKLYVGQTVNTIQMRWETGHRRDARSSKQCKSAISSAIRKYGEDAFDLETIDWALSQEALDHKERFWIEFLDTMANDGWGYNLREGGSNGRLTEEARAKISKANKGRRRDPKLNIAHSNKLKAMFASGQISYKGRSLVKKRKPVMCVETRQQFDSLGAAALHVRAAINGKPHPSALSNISSAARRGHTAYGYHWVMICKLMKENN